MTTTKRPRPTFPPNREITEGIPGWLFWPGLALFVAAYLALIAVVVVDGLQRAGVWK